MRKFLFSMSIVLLVATIAAVGAFGFTNSYTVQLDAQDAVALNRMNGAATRAHLGTRLRGPLTTGVTTSIVCKTSSGACNNVATTESTALTVKYTGGSWAESFVIANGQRDQVKTYVLAIDGGQDFTVSPTTKTGFVSATLNDVKDSVTIKYIDDTIGWVLIGNNGATIN